jgi:hypothetical protein
LRARVGKATPAEKNGFAGAPTSISAPSSRPSSAPEASGSDFGSATSAVPAGSAM